MGLLDFVKKNKSQNNQQQNQNSQQQTAYSDQPQDQNQSNLPDIGQITQGNPQQGDNLTQTSISPFGDQNTQVLNENYAQGNLPQTTSSQNATQGDDQAQTNQQDTSTQNSQDNNQSPSGNMNFQVPDLSSVIVGSTPQASQIPNDNDSQKTPEIEITDGSLGNNNQNNLQQINQGQQETQQPETTIPNLSIPDLSQFTQSQNSSNGDQAGQQADPIQTQPYQPVESQSSETVVNDLNIQLNSDQEAQKDNTDPGLNSNPDDTNNKSTQQNNSQFVPDLSSLKIPDLSGVAPLQPARNAENSYQTEQSDASESLKPQDTQQDNQVIDLTQTNEVGGNDAQVQDSTNNQQQNFENESQTDQSKTGAEAQTEPVLEPAGQEINQQAELETAPETNTQESTPEDQANPTTDSVQIGIDQSQETSNSDEMQPDLEQNQEDQSDENIQIGSQEQESSDNISQSQDASDTSIQNSLEDQTLQNQQTEPNALQNVMPNNLPEVQSQSQDTPVIETEAAYAKNITADFLDKVALIGLDGPKFDTTMGEGVKNLVKGLHNKSLEIIIDSKQGLGSFAWQAASDIGAKPKGIYLRPYYSDAGANSSQAMPPQKGTLFIYSSFLEQVKHILKESEVFVVFEGGGSYNYSLVINILTIASMYKGQHKPVILVGAGWQEKIDFFKKNLGFDIDESIYKIVNTPAEALTAVDQIRQSYKVDKDSNIAKIVDRRIEGDERDFMVHS